VHWPSNGTFEDGDMQVSETDSGSAPVAGASRQSRHDAERFARVPRDSRVDGPHLDRHVQSSGWQCLTHGTCASRRRDQVGLRGSFQE